MSRPQPGRRPSAVPESMDVEGADTRAAAMADPYLVNVAVAGLITIYLPRKVDPNAPSPTTPAAPAASEAAAPETADANPAEPLPAEADAADSPAAVAGDDPASATEPAAATADAADEPDAAAAKPAENAKPEATPSAGDAEAAASQDDKPPPSEKSDTENENEGLAAEPEIVSSTATRSNANSPRLWQTAGPTGINQESGMKNFMSKLKGMDYKQFAMAHGEKLAFGFVALFLLLAILSTPMPWSAYDKTPEDMKLAAEKSAKNVVESTWPDDRRQAFAPSDYYAKAEAMFQPLTGEVFAYAAPMSFPLYPKQEPIKEPEFEKVEALIADAGRMIVPKQTGEGALGEEEEMPAEGEGEEDSEDAEFRRRDNLAATGGAAGVGAVGREGVGDPGVAGAAMDPGKMMQRMMANKGGAGAPSAFAPGEEGSEDLNAPQGEGKRFISVRGTFDLRKQIKNFQKAIHTDTEMEAAELIEFHNFQLERQRAVAGPDPWAGPWEPVNTQLSVDYLLEQQDYDTDVVDPSVTNDVLTSPLPVRLQGTWTERLVSHPDLKLFELTKEERELQAELNSEILNAYGEMEGAEDLDAIPQKGGFAKLQIDMGQVRQKVFSSQRNSAEQMMSKVMTSQNAARGRGAAASPAGMMPGPMPKGMAMGMGMGSMQGNFQQRLAATGRVVLFRYLDFDVEPGQAYRYRVKLTLVNPSALRSLDEVVDQSVIAGDFRETAWSEPSTPAVVENDTEVFLVDIDQRARTRGTAEMAVYQWDPAYGTFIASVLDTVFGQYIGGKKKTLRLDVARPSLEEEDVKFSTRKILVDSHPTPQVFVADHPDLKLPVTTRTRQRSEIGIADTAIVINRYGELERLDNVSGLANKSRADALVERERAPFEAELEKSKEEGSELDAMAEKMRTAAEGMMPAGMAGGSAGGSQKKKPNPARRGGGGRSGRNAGEPAA